MKNSTYILTNTMSDQPNSLKCVNYAINTLQKNQTLFKGTKVICKKKELINILSYLIKFVLYSTITS